MNLLRNKNCFEDFFHGTIYQEYYWGNFFFEAYLTDLTHTLLPSKTIASLRMSDTPRLLNSCS